MGLAFNNYLSAHKDQTTMHKSYSLRIAYFFFSIILLLSPEKSMAQTTIEVAINGVSNDSCSIGYYYGDKQYVKGEFYVDIAGQGKFESTETLKDGIYMLVLPDNNYVEFLMHGEDFKIVADASDLSACIFEGSKENQLFQTYSTAKESYENQKHEIELTRGDEDTRKEKIRKISEEYYSIVGGIIEDNPGMMVSKILTAKGGINIPESIPVDEKYIYYREHMFDNFNFNDEWLLRSPILSNRMEQCIEKMTPQHHYSIIASIDQLIKKVEVNDETFKYTVITFLNKYAKHKAMFAGNVYVHIVQKYYLTGKAVWADKEQMDKLKDRELKMHNSILDVQAKDFELETMAQERIKMSEIKSDYLVLFFWDSDCKNCMKEGDELAEFYKTYHSKGVKILGISINSEKEEITEAAIQHGFTWRNGVPTSAQTKVNYDAYTTPLIYLLDKDRKIIGRRIDVSTLEKFISYKLEKQK